MNDGLIIACVVMSYPPPLPFPVLTSIFFMFLITRRWEDLPQSNRLSPPSRRGKSGRRSFPSDLSWRISTRELLLYLVPLLFAARKLYLLKKSLFCLILWLFLRVNWLLLMLTPLATPRQGRSALDA